LSPEEIQYFIDVLPPETDFHQAEERRLMGADGRNVTDMAQIMPPDPTIFSTYREESPVTGHKGGDTPQSGALKESLSDPKFEER
jgi:hypothetical protein